ALNSGNLHNQAVTSLIGHDLAGKAAAWASFRHHEIEHLRLQGAGWRQKMSLIAGNVHVAGGTTAGPAAVTQNPIHRFSCRRAHKTCSVRHIQCSGDTAGTDEGDTRHGHTYLKRV